MAYWNKDEEDIVRQHLINKDANRVQMAKQLGRSYKSIDAKVTEIKAELEDMSPQSPSIDMATKDSFISMLKELVQSDYKVKRFPTMKPSSKGKSKEILNLLISDVHTGKINTWYDTVENKKLITYNDEIRKTFERRYIESIKRLLSLWYHGYFFEKLNIMLLGDIIDNDRIFEGQKTIITMSAGQQIWTAVAELADMISCLAGYFPQVEVIGIVGNHGRSTSMGREEEPVENNFEYHVYKILGLMLQEIKNVTVTVPNSRFYSIKNYEHRIFMSHGDTIKGYTISYVERKAKELLINLPEGYSLYCIGHRHRADRIGLSPTAELLVNGCWIPNDDYAFNLYGVSTQPSQWCFGTSKHRVISSLCVPIDFRGGYGNHPAP
jgi:hypothetical protein